MAKAKTAITPTRDENFPDWYQEVIKAGELAENSPVRGSMIIKPNGYALWENIQRSLDDLIKAEEVENAYFPLLIPLSFISREAEHIDGFAKECAVVTHHRLQKGENGGLVPAPEAELEEPYVIRPTSETIIGDAVARWVQSYRDLPLKLNQWANVMRWELRTRAFLRTSEFLWQEGHNAFETPEEAEADARKMLEVYNTLYTNYLAIPGIMGEKTAEERFPGADASYTIEAMMQDGKAVQACTSHNLGQNFSRSFGIQYQGRDGQVHLAHTTSWGLSTRSIGAMIMTHSDDDGVIMPPRVAPVQVMILPVIKNDADEAAIHAACETLKKRLKDKGVSAKVDLSEARTPDKMWKAIKRGVPYRVEIGAREVEAGQLTHVRRDLGRESKATVSVDQFVSEITGNLDAMHNDLYAKAKSLVDSRIIEGADLSAIRSFFADGGIGFVKAPSAILDDPAYTALQKEFALSSRCLPFKDNGKTVLVGKAY